MNPKAIYTQNIPVQKYVNKNFFKTWTQDMAYVLGFFAADGYITVNKRGSTYWCIGITDRKLLENIRLCIGSNHVISKRVYKHKGKDLYRFQIGSIEMCEDLRKLGFWLNKTQSLAVPFVPEAFFSHFIRGYFDGDGNVWVGKVKNTGQDGYTRIIVGFTSSSYQFLNSIHEKMSLILGVSGSLFKTKRGSFRLQFGQRDSLKMYNFMYNGLTSPLFLERKRVVFEKYIHMRL